MFFSLLSLKYISYLFFLLFPPCCRVSSSFPSSTTPPRLEARREAIRAPLSSSLPSIRLSSAPPAFCVCALKLSGGLLCVLPCVVLLPSLVSRQAQDSMTVWADAPRVCPRPCPCLLLPMCCRCSFRVSRCPFRGLSCGLSCLLSCVVWW